MNPNNIITLRPHSDETPPTKPADASLQALIPTKRIPGVMGACVTAGACLATGAMSWLLFSHSPPPPPAPIPAEQPIVGVLSTAADQRGCWHLPDISTTCLNYATSVRYSFTSKARNLEVITGDAIFNVHWEDRPFDVASGRALIRDLGTIFHVCKRSDEVATTVVAGQVEVIGLINDQKRPSTSIGGPEADWSAAADLQRFDQVVVDNATGLLRKRPALTKKQLSELLFWQDELIDLTGKSLGEALEAFSRYWPGEDFEILDPDLRQMKLVGGVAYATDLPGFLNSLILRDIGYLQMLEPNGRTKTALWRIRPGR